VTDAGVWARTLPALSVFDKNAVAAASSDASEIAMWLYCPGVSSSGDMGRRDARWMLAGRSCARGFAENASASSTTGLHSLADYQNTFTIGGRSDYGVSGARRRTT
jgi:hypothetical protein